MGGRFAAFEFLPAPAERSVSFPAAGWHPSDAIFHKAIGFDKNIEWNVRTFYSVDNCAKRANGGRKREVTDEVSH